MNWIKQRDNALDSLKGLNTKGTMLDYLKSKYIRGELNFVSFEKQVAYLIEYGREDTDQFVFYSRRFFSWQPRENPFALSPIQLLELGI